MERDPEFDRSFEWSSLGREAVDLFKHGAMYKQQPEFFWHSHDDDIRYAYWAVPLHQSDEPIDITRLLQVPLDRYSELFRQWLMIRIDRSPEDGEAPIRQYFFDSHAEPRVRYSGHLSENLTETVDILRRGADVVDPRQLPKINVRETEDLMSAIDEVQPFVQLATEEYYIRRDLMTKDELRAERAQKYQFFDDEPESDKLKDVKYWLYDSNFGYLSVVMAKSRDFAAAIMDEEGLINPFFFSITALEDEYVEQYDGILSDEREFVRLIPFSRVPWPDDMENQTPEQIEAFKKLKID